MKHMGIDCTQGGRHESEWYRRGGLVMLSKYKDQSIPKLVPLIPMFTNMYEYANSLTHLERSSL